MQNLVIGLVTRFFRDKETFEFWIRWHLSRGATHIFILDNGSRFDMKSVCEKYGSTVSYEQKDGPICQWDYYTKWIRGLKKDAIFMPIDDDEYLYLEPGYTLDRLMISDCLAIRWKHLWPDRLHSERKTNVLEYCTKTNPYYTKLINGCGDRIVKCAVRAKAFLEYMLDKKDIDRRMIPSTISGTAALCDGHIVSIHTTSHVPSIEPVRLIHCPYSGYSEYKHKQANHYNISDKIPTNKIYVKLFDKMLEQLE